MSAPITCVAIPQRWQLYSLFPYKSISSTTPSVPPPVYSSTFKSALWADRYEKLKWYTYSILLGAD